MRIGVNKLVGKVSINLIMSHKVYFVMRTQLLCNQHNYQMYLLVRLTSYTPKQIDLTSVFVTTAALFCQRVIVNKQM